MARKRSEHPEPVQQPRAAVTVPDVFKIGALTEVWSDTGHRYDLGSAWGNHGRARDAWGAAEGLSHDETYKIAGGGSPWSLQVPDWQRESGRPYPDPAERLAKLGLTEADIPRLRRAAQQRVVDTDPYRRSTS